MPGGICFSTVWRHAVDLRQRGIDVHGRLEEDLMIP